MGLAVLCLFAGCPEQAAVTVTVKPVSGAASGAAAEAGTADTEAKGYGTLAGTITFDGAPLRRGRLCAITVKEEDKAVCAAAPMPDETLEVNSANKGIANVVIFLEKRPANIKPELAKPPTEPVLFDQKGCRFLPHVIVVQAGQPLLVVSDDAIPHNTHTNPKRNEGFNKVIPANDRKGTPCNYRKPEAGPISVVCDLPPLDEGLSFSGRSPLCCGDRQGWKIQDRGAAGRQAQLQRLARTRPRRQPVAGTKAANHH